jgi:sugar lactone lactonase YvrE
LLFIILVRKDKVLLLLSDLMLSKLSNSVRHLWLINFYLSTPLTLRLHIKLLQQSYLAFLIFFLGLLLVPALTPPGLAQVITTAAGNGSENVLATSAQLNEPMGVAVDGSGNLYIADRANHRIRKVSSSGIITTVAGTGVVGYSGDGGQATCAQLYSPFGVAVDGSGNLYIADFGNHCIRKVSPSGIITTVAGTGAYGYGGDEGPATSAQLSYPLDVTVDGSGNLYIADRDNNRIRKVNASGIITTVAGTGTYGYSGDGGAAAFAQLHSPTSVAMDGDGNLYLADMGNHRIRKVNPSGVITTVAGNGYGCDIGDCKQATSARLNFPFGVAIKGNSTLYLADLGNYRIRKITNTNALLTSLKAGNWTDPGVWSCGRIPVSADKVQINHTISLPDDYRAQALDIYYGINGQLFMNAHSSLELGQL